MTKKILKGVFCLSLTILPHHDQKGISLKAKQTLVLDPAFNEDYKTTDILLFTHLSADLLALLADKKRTNRVFLPQMLHKQLQKLQRTQVIEPLYWDNIKCFVYGYPISIGDFFVTAYLSDDGLNGAISLLLEYHDKKIGYTGHFITQGLHKKRIKKWKKELQSSQLDLLLLDSANLQQAARFTTNAKKFKRFLQNLTPEELPAVKLSYLAPEMIVDYHNNALKNGRTLLLDQTYATLAKQLFPFDDFTVATTENLALAVAHPDKFILQAGIAENNTTIYNKDEVLSLKQFTGDQTTSELKEFVHVIKPQKCVFFGLNDLDFSQKITTSLTVEE